MVQLLIQMIIALLVNALLLFDFTFNSNDGSILLQILIQVPFQTTIKYYDPNTFLFFNLIPRPSTKLSPFLRLLDFPLDYTIDTKVDSGIRSCDTTSICQIIGADPNHL